jgi:hypothetical protein
VSYRLANGLTINGVDEEEVALVLGALKYWGAPMDECPNPEDAVARALATFLTHRQTEAAEERRLAKQHERSAYQLKVDQQLREAREKANRWWLECRDEEGM